MKKLLVLLLLPLGVYAATAHDNYFCPTQGSISFTLDNSTSYSITSDQAKTWDKGNPYTGDKRISPDFNSNIKVGCIVIKAGRKNSSAVANWAAQNIFTSPGISGYGAYPTTYTLYPDSSNPEDPSCNSDGTICNPKLLNFAFKGTLHIKVPNNAATTAASSSTIQYDCPEVIIAQGSEKFNSGNINNWWIYGNLNTIPNYHSYRIMCKNSSTNTRVDFIASVVNSPNQSFIMKFAPIN